MASEHGGAPWWAVVASGVTGALVATGIALVGVGQPAGRAAAAEQPAVTEHPAAGTDAQARPSVTFIGDSWTEGIGASALRGYAVLTGEELDWDYTVLGVGGSGYLAPGRGSTFEERIGQAVRTDADIIVVQGGLNERDNEVADLAPAALATLTRLRDAAGPGTEILVLGASYTPGTDAAVIHAINTTVSAAAATAGLPFVDPAAENWTDPADPSIWHDPLHPNDAGYQLVAHHLASLLRATGQH
ncbi:MAG: uncharacterized protein JWQ45_594 [Blastococcus sp.]|nr:uncharacterized protein [Blastococcus sp.]